MILSLLASCVAPDPEGPTPRSLRDETLSGPNPIGPLAVQPGFRPDKTARLGLTADELEPTPSWRRAGESVLPPLWSELRGVDLDMDRGQRMTERLDELPRADVAQNGVAALTLPEMWGTPENNYEDALCEPLGLSWWFDEDGVDYEGELLLWQYNAFTMPILPFTVVVSPTCSAALDGTVAPADAVSSGACIPTDEWSFFPGGSACRGCLEEDAWGACVEAAACPETAQQVFNWAGGDDRFTMVEVTYSFILACAPNWMSLIYLVSRADDDPEPPKPFEQDKWIGYCLPYRDEGTREIWIACVGEDLLPEHESHTLAEGVPTRVVHIRPEGTDIAGWYDRPSYLQSIRMSNGLDVSVFWAGPSPGLGPLSAPASQGGWNVNPTWLRPDGTDPTWPDDTFARDYVAAYTLKTSTARNGVLVSFDNHNRCDEWQGPDAAGRYRCAHMGPPVDGWADDGFLGDAGAGTVFVNPVRTIASTGLADPDVPGGAAIFVAGSPAFEQIEHWSYPHTFVPDVIPYDDGVTGPGTTGAGILEGQGYKFDKSSEWDIRMVMGSNWQRFARPLDGEGGRP